MKEKEIRLAVDLGGTKILIGEVDEDGVILHSKAYPSNTKNQEQAVETMIQAMKLYVELEMVSTQIQSIGIGVVGRVDYKRGIWIEIDPHRSQRIELCTLIEEQFHLPCFIDNDVNCATIAEQVFGVGKISADFIYINIGTGLAAGMISDDRLIRGAKYNAGEIGHSVVDMKSQLECVCGRHGCVESYISGAGMNVQIQSLQKRVNTFLTDRDTYYATEKIFQGYQKQDPLCVEVIDTALNSLANLLMNLVRVSDPDAIVLGGGVVRDGFLLTLLKPKLKNETMRFVSNGVCLTKLDSSKIALIGAGMIGRKGADYEHYNSQR